MVCAFSTHGTTLFSFFAICGETIAYDLTTALWLTNSPLTDARTVFSDTKETPHMSITASDDHGSSQIFDTGFTSFCQESRTGHWNQSTLGAKIISAIFNFDDMEINFFILWGWELEGNGQSQKQIR